MLKISYPSHLCKCLPVPLVAWDTACIQWLQLWHAQRLHDADPASQACHSSWTMQLCTQAAAHGGLISQSVGNGFCCGAFIFIGINLSGFRDAKSPASVPSWC